MTFPELPELEHLAQRAGAILRAGYNKDHQVAYKGVIDLVTEVDHASEDYLLAEINRRWPGNSTCRRCRPFSCFPPMIWSSPGKTA